MAQYFELTIPLRLRDSHIPFSLHSACIPSPSRLLFQPDYRRCPSSLLLSQPLSHTLCRLEMVQSPVSTSKRTRRSVYPRGILSVQMRLCGSQDLGSRNLYGIIICHVSTVSIQSQLINDDLINPALALFLTVLLSRGHRTVFGGICASWTSVP